MDLPTLEADVKAEFERAKNAIANKLHDLLGTDAAESLIGDATIVALDFARSLAENGFPALRLVNGILVIGEEKIAAALEALAAKAGGNTKPPPPPDVTPASTGETAQDTIARLEALVKEQALKLTGQSVSE